MIFKQQVLNAMEKKIIIALLCACLGWIALLANDDIIRILFIDELVIGYKT